MRRIVQGLFLVLFAAAVAVAGLLAWGVRQFGGLTTVEVAGLAPLDDGQVANWLLVGTDSRDGIDPSDPDAGVFLGEPVVGNRTDTIMILRVDRDAGTADLLSIPRDLWVPIAGTGSEGRINGAFNGAGGRGRLVSTVSDSLGIEIHQYAEVSLVGFRQLVDAIGGVPLWFENPARDVGSGLFIAERGCHVVNGAQGLAVARARTFEELIDGEWRLEPTGDLGRTARQRRFLGELVGAASDRSTIAKIGLVDDVLSATGQNLVVGDAASTGDLIRLARALSSMGPDGLVGHSLPVADFRTGGGAQVLRLQESEADEVLSVFRGAPSALASSAGSNGQANAGSPSADRPDGVTPVPVPAEPSAATAAPTVDAESAASGYGVFGFVAASDPIGTPCE